MNINIASREDVYEIFSDMTFRRFGIHEKHFENEPEILCELLKNRELRKCSNVKEPVYCLTKHGDAILKEYMKSGELSKSVVPNFESERTCIKMYELFVPNIGVRESRFDKSNPIVFGDMIKNGEIEKQPYTEGETFYRLTEKGKKKLDEFLEFEELEWQI